MTVRKTLRILAGTCVVIAVIATLAPTASSATKRTTASTKSVKTTKKKATPSSTKPWTTTSIQRPATTTTAPVATALLDFVLGYSASGPIVAPQFYRWTKMSLKGNLLTITDHANQQDTVTRGTIPDAVILSVLAAAKEAAVAAANDPVFDPCPGSGSTSLGISLAGKDVFTRSETTCGGSNRPNRISEVMAPLSNWLRANKLS